ncbi:MAG: glycerate kinase [Verrucomicrobiota bacterium]
MKLLIAFDKFKDSMTAPYACELAARAAATAFGEKVDIEQAPLTDGGEGFCSILTQVAGGRLSEHLVSGPLGQKVTAPIGWVQAEDLPSQVHALLPLAAGKIAVIEMASAAGLEQVPSEQRHPNNCTTYGVGQLIQIASTQSADAILLGIGGSATSDIGFGALEALGIQFLNTSGQALTNVTPADWDQIDQISGSTRGTIPPIFIACDVENPLLGPQGAAAVYGPQKGLTPEEIEPFDHKAGTLAAKLCAAVDQNFSLKDIPGSGAAGGIGFALKVCCGASFVAGFDLVTAWLDLETRMLRADAVLSGEGKIDRSSLAGKGPIALIKAAAAADKGAYLFAGALEDGIEAELSKLHQACQAFAISPKEMTLKEALAKGPENLELSVTKALRSAAKR